MILRFVRLLFLPFLPLVLLLAKQLNKKDNQWLAKAIFISIQSFFADRVSPNYQLGSFLLSQHDPDQALHFLTLAQKLKPGAINISCNLALANWETGNVAAAIELTESFIANKSPKSSVLLHCQSKYFIHNEEYVQAESVLKKIVDRDKKYAAAYYDLGMLNKQFFQQSEQAKAYFIQVLEIDQDFVDAHIELAKLLFNERLYEEAIPHFITAINNIKTDFTLFNGLIRCCIRTKQFNEGLVFCDQTRQYFPQQPELLFFYGECYRGINANEQSIAVLNQAISLVADYADAYASLAYTYRNAGQFKLALQHINKAIQITPDKADYLNVKGLIHEELMELDDAIASFNQAYELNSEFNTVLWHRAMVKLLSFDFKTGWQDYAYRFMSGAQQRRDFSFQEWNGESLSGKKLLIYAEQGLGDELMFASCISDIIEQSDLCIIDCSEKLETLFRRSFPKAMVKTSDQDGPCPWKNDINVDFQVSVADLPMYYRNSWEQFPRKPYLLASEDRTHYWRTKLKSLEGEFNVGISWVGGAHQTRRHWRSFALQTLLPILTLKNINFISLQYTDCMDEIEHFESKNGIKVHHWQQAIDDYDETAALVSALDLVISVQTAIIHLAGALGKPAWVMVRNNPEWRYGAEGDEMPWYGTVKLFRQQQFGDWLAVIEQVSEALKQLMKK